MTQAAFACVVGRIDYRIAQKRLEVLFMIVEFLTHAVRSGSETAQQQTFHVVAGLFTRCDLIDLAIVITLCSNRVHGVSFLMALSFVKIETAVEMGVVSKSRKPESKKTPYK